MQREAGSQDLSIDKNKNSQRENKMQPDEWWEQIETMSFIHTTVFEEDVEKDWCWRCKEEQEMNDNDFQRLTEIRLDVNKYNNKICFPLMLDA